MTHTKYAVNGDPRFEPNPPATIERTISTEMDSPNDIPHDVTIYYCYQMVGSKALVSRSEIEIECAYLWDSQLEHAEQEIDNDLHPTEVIYTK